MTSVGSLENLDNGLPLFHILEGFKKCLQATRNDSSVMTENLGISIILGSSCPSEFCHL